jgi:hypothetical protein
MPWMTNVNQGIISCEVGRCLVGTSELDLNPFRVKNAKGLLRFVLAHRRRLSLATYVEYLMIIM